MIVFYIIDTIMETLWSILKGLLLAILVLLGVGKDVFKDES